MPRVASVRISPDNETVLDSLGFLADLAGSWQGTGFNLIARPDFHDRANLYLQLNQTRENLKIDPIGSSIPNRGFEQDDIELFGLTYLQKISDRFTGGALHIEPGIWINEPATTGPEQEPPEGGQIVCRMATIPHGNSLLAQGAAHRFTGPPTLRTDTEEYAFSAFPSFNSTPFLAELPPASPIINAAGSSEKITGPKAAPGAVPFSQYDFDTASGPDNPRTPYGTLPPEPDLPKEIDGVAMQDVINDPIKLLQTVVERQAGAGHTFEGVALNIATQSKVSFRKNPDDPTGDVRDVPIPDGAGGIENIPFLVGDPTPTGPNAQTGLVYATFWIEKVSHPESAAFMQLQYAQMTVLNYPILKAPDPKPDLGWPHISVATLTKGFN